MNLQDLKKPFDPDRVSWRVGSTKQDKSAGLALAYIDSRDVQERLDDVCGPENWQDRYHVFGTTMICEIGLRIGDNWVWKADGAGSTDIEAEKGQISDAFKRCAVKWGIGRYLYEIDSPWVDIEPMGKSFRIKKDQKGKLRAALVAGSCATAPGEYQEARLSAPVIQTASATKSAHSPPKMTAKQWGEDARDTIRGLKNDQADAWMEANTLALVKLRTAEPTLHADIIALVQQKMSLANPAHSG